ncbi:MAG: hypothetical protein WHV28_06025 [Bacteroidota bacterium]
MKKTIVIFFLLSISFAKAQFIEDALRYANTQHFITSRAAGLNVSYIGISDDINALISNPAGLALIPKNEFSVGFGFSHIGNEVSIFNKKSNFNVNNEYLSHLALASPISGDNGITTVAVGYFKDNDFKNSYDYNVFNTQSSYIFQQSQAKKRWTYDLLLADINGNTNIKDSLRQTSFVDETGGTHNITGGVGLDVGENVSLGFSITGKWGTFEYSREFIEWDELNLYNKWQIDDFDKLIVKEKIQQNVSGITAQFGLLGKIEDFMRISFSIKLPTWYQVDEKFSVSHDVIFDKNPQGIVDRFDTTQQGKNSYNIRTPFVYSAGLSFHLLGLTFSAGVEYQDVTQMKFSDASAEVAEQFDVLNRIIIRHLVGQTTWGFGAEYKFPALPLEARASYAKTTSPYQLDIPNAAKSTFSLGGSLYLSKGVRIDGVLRWTDFSEQRTAYGNEENTLTLSNYILKQKPLNILLGVSYRY